MEENKKEPQKVRFEMRIDAEMRDAIITRAKEAGISAAEMVRVFCEIGLKTPRLKRLDVDEEAHALFVSWCMKNGFIEYQTLSEMIREFVEKDSS